MFSEKYKVQTEPINGPECGLTLLELLISLAMLSIVTILLAQSVTTQWRIVSRVSSNIETIQTEDLRQSLFTDFTSRLQPQWPDQSEHRFQGRADGYSGLTIGTGVRPGLTPIRAALTGDPGRRRLSMTIGDAPLALLQDLGDAAFSYRGLDGRWYPVWPPAETPGNGVDRPPYAYLTPQLPNAVRLTFTDQQTERAWVALLGSDPALPPRPQDAGEVLP